jgi:uncharacterized membrane protein YbhN (UPF0104 family)
MIAALVIVLAIGLGGSTLFPPPASRWFLVLAFGAALVLLLLGVGLVADGWRERREARRRSRLDVRTWRGL